MSDQPQNQILTALIAKFEAERLQAIANLNVFINNPSALPDHPDVVGEAAKLVNAIAHAEGCLSTLRPAAPPEGKPDAADN